MYSNRKIRKIGIGAWNSDPYGKNKNTVEFESFLTRICTVNLSIFYEVCRGVNGPRYFCLQCMKIK